MFNDERTTRMAVRVTKQRTGVNKKGHHSRGGTVYVPARVAKLIPADARFEAELIEDGILYRFVGFDEFSKKSYRPKWALGEQEQAYTKGADAQ